MTIRQAFQSALRCHQAGRLDEAEAIYRQILAVEPRHGDALHMLGAVAHQTGRDDLAVELIGQAVALRPDDAASHSNLSAALRALGRMDEAIAAGRTAIRLQPDFGAGHSNLGNALRDQGRLDEAVAAYRRAIEIAPNHADAHNNLGLAFKEQGKLDEAVACYRRTLELRPEAAKVHNDLGDALRDQGRIDEAVACYRRAAALEPRDVSIRSNLVYALHFHPAHDAVSIREEQRRWNRQFAEPLRGCLQPHANARDSERPLLIGYVSPNLCGHVVGVNVLPILERHDRARFKVFCYAAVARPDDLTRRFQKTADVWRNIVSASDEAVAEIIRADQIDILVDLTLHMPGQRLTVFARQPAPVQVSWAGYPGATGLDAISYRLTDPYLDPPGAAEERASEKPIRLPHSFWCYDPLTGSPSVSPLPALSAGRVTFGSLNSYGKVNDAVIALWSRVLCAVKGSRLVLLSQEGMHRERALEEFRRHGVAPDRIEWFTPAARAQYLAAYHRIDLGLDTAPYNGHTTSLDSAWMGVPVITLVGKTTVGRGGLSQAMNLGLPELVAHTPEEYVQRTVELAANLPRLAELRRTLRERMQASPIMDAERFTRDLEEAYRGMWRGWCDKP